MQASNTACLIFEAQIYFRYMSFTARENLRRTLEYRPHVRASYKALLGFTGLSLLLVMGFSFYYFSVARDPVMALAILGGGLLAPLILFLEAHFLARPLASTRVHVRADGITVERLGQNHDIHFSSLAGVKFSHIPYLGGWFKLIQQSGDAYRFTVVLERSEYILEAISAVRPGIVRSEDLLAYRRTAILSDHSWARVYAKTKNWPALVLKYFVLPILLSGATLAAMRANQMPINGAQVAKLFLLMLGLNFAVGMTISFALSELVLVMAGKERLEKDPSDVVRDLALEKKVSTIAHVGHWILAFAILAVALFRFI